MSNQFSKHAIAIALATLFSVSTANATSTDSFAELDAAVAELNKPFSEKKADFHAYVNQYLDEYEAWRDAYTAELDKRKGELIAKWGEGDVSDNTSSVIYSDDGKVRTTIDYQDGTMEVSVLVNDPESLDNTLQTAKENVKTEEEIAFDFANAQVSEEDVSYSKEQELIERLFILQQTEAQMNEMDIQAERLIRTNTGIPADFIYERAYNKKMNLLKQAQTRLDNLAALYEAQRNKPAQEEVVVVEQVVEETVEPQQPEVKPQPEIKPQPAPQPVVKKPAPRKAPPKKVVNYKVKIPQNTLSSRAKKYQPYAEKESKRFNIDAPLVMAIMHSESAFRPNAKSHIPAYGLMQIVPNTAGHDVNKQIRNKNKPMTAKELYTAPINVETGAAYLHILNHKYLKYIKNDESRLYCTIAAYNTGAGNVARAFNPNRSTNIKKASVIINKMTPQQVYNKLMANLPYSETKNYLKKVNGRIALYKK